MIKANELRIGNWISSKLENSNHTVKGFLDKINGTTVLYTDLQESYSDLEDFEPVPLTPEILESCGFEIESFAIKKGELRLSTHTGYIYHPEGMKGVRVVALHQLQNLYFALTGEELPINLSYLSSTHQNNSVK